MKFKKLLLLLFVTLILSLPMTSCLKDNSRIEQSDIIEIDSAALMDMEMVTDFAVVEQTVASTQEGAYKLLGDAGGGGSFIYYDYKTMQLVYVSNQLIATNDETNPGWISDVRGGAYPLTLNHKLYVVSLGRAPMPDLQFDGYVASVMQMDFNGANRKKISCPNYEISMSSAIVTDGMYLYFLATEFNNDGERSGVLSLCRANFEKEEIETVAHFDKTNIEYNIVSVFDDGIILQAGVFENEKDDVNAYANVTIKYLSYNIKKATLTEHLSFKNLAISGVIDKHEIIFFEKDADGNPTPILKRLNLLEGNTTDIIDISKKLPVIKDAEQCELLGKVIDNHVFFFLYDENLDSVVYYTLNLNTKKIQEFSLFLDDGLRIVDVVAETDKYFLVSTGTHHFVQTTLYEGSYADITREEPMYSLISKDDYWASIPNYIEFEDYVFTTFESYDPYD